MIRCLPRGVRSAVADGFDLAPFDGDADRVGRVLGAQGGNTGADIGPGRTDRKFHPVRDLAVLEALGVELKGLLLPGVEGVLTRALLHPSALGRGRDHVVSCGVYRHRLIYPMSGLIPSTRPARISP